MKSNIRIASVLEANTLDSAITGFPTFDLSELALPDQLDFTLPTNLRLGHLVEYIVSELIRSSSNFILLHENIQIQENERTIGELDFIIKNQKTQQIHHIELAYKFYLLDLASPESVENYWIGPNRNDSLHAKLDKLERKQFPLLFESSSRQVLDNIDVEEVRQSLCMLAYLFIPYTAKLDLNPSLSKNIKGYYLNYDTLQSLDKAESKYYLPPKREWGIDPSDNKTWTTYDAIEEQIRSSLAEHQSLLCWKKKNKVYSQFFIVWW